MRKKTESTLALLLCLVLCLSLLPAMSFAEEGTAAIAETDEDVIYEMLRDFEI